MFRVKICGITSIEDARLAIDAGADAIGLNFVRTSPRCVTPDTARRIAQGVGDRALRVGVLVDQPPDEILRLAADVPLDAVQLHGDESPETIAALAKLKIIRAFRLRLGQLSAVTDYLAECSRRGCMPAAVLLDAFDPAQHGGSGKLGDWDSAAQYARQAGGGDMPPLILAGGLRAENVATAIAQVSPAAVDVASGVESAPGRKDGQAVAAYVENARQAFSTFTSPKRQRG